MPEAHVDVFKGLTPCCCYLHANRSQQWRLHLTAALTASDTVQLIAHVDVSSPLPAHADSPRVLRLLERAPRSIRLVADSEPLEVVFEDDRFLAVSKPPGLRSAPVHRFMGGSAVNRMIGYLAGSTPYLLHR